MRQRKTNVCGGHTNYVQSFMLLSKSAQFFAMPPHYIALVIHSATNCLGKIGLDFTTSYMYVLTC